MKSNGLLVLVCVLSLLVPGRSATGVENLSVVGSNDLIYWLEEETNRERLEEELALTLGLGSFGAGIEISAREPSAVHNPFRKEGVTKRYLSWTSDLLGIQVGNAYTTFGRGLTLRAYRDREFDMDRDIDGVKLNATVGPLDLVALSGRPREILRDRILPDTSDVLRGADLSLSLFPGLTFGGSYVRLNTPAPLIADSFKVTELGGGFIASSAEFLGASFEAYAEGVARSGWDRITFADLTGDGIYLSSSLSIPGFALSFEYKNYDNLGYGYNAPPHCNHYGRYLTEARDEYGYQIGAHLSPLSDLSVEASYAYAVNHTASLALTEAYAEARWDHSDLGWIVASLDWLYDEDPYTSDSVQTIPATEAWYYLGESQAVGLSYNHKFVSRDEGLYPEDDYEDQRISLSYSRDPLFTVTATSDWTTGPEQDGNTSWQSGQVTLHLDDHHELTVGVGSERGAIVCSGGFCRWEPAFDGVKIHLRSWF